MAMRLEYIGLPGPHRDMRKFVGAVQAYKPGITDTEIESVVHRESVRKRPRHNGQQFQVFGADIMSDDLKSMDAWPHLIGQWQRDLPMFPLQGGIVVGSDEEYAAVRLKVAIDTHGAQHINRASLLVPEGLSKTYVWCQANGFTQQVTDADVAIIRRTQILNLMFRNPDIADGPMRIEGFMRQATDKHAFTTIAEAKAYEADTAPVQQWKGV